MQGSVEQLQTIPKAVAKAVNIQSPPAKAYTLRALLFAAFADGTSVLRNPLLADDQLKMIDCLRNLGVRIDIAGQSGQEVITVQGCNGHFQPLAEQLFVGDSGVTMNFLCSAACFASKPVILTGTARLNERPIKEVIDGVLQLGAQVEYLGTVGFPPVKIKPARLSGGRAVINGAITSQYFSSLVISAPYAASLVELVCADSMTERPYFDISTSMMQTFGVSVKNTDYRIITIPNHKHYQAQDLAIEGDFSSASFLFLGAMVLGSAVTVQGLNRTSVQGDRRFLDLAERMGCKVSWNGSAVTIAGNAMQAIEEDMSDIPDLVPPMAVAAAFASGTSRFTNIAHLVHKESNRVLAMVTELQKMGIDAGFDQSSMWVTGKSARMHGAQLATYNDHRIAMSLAIAGLATGNQIIENPGCVGKSFPDFWERIKAFY